MSDSDRATKLRTDYRRMKERAPRLDMPAYRKPFVSDQELADMYFYLATIKPSPAAKDLPLPNFP